MNIPQQEKVKLHRQTIAKPESHRNLRSGLRSGLNMAKVLLWIRVEQGGHLILQQRQLLADGLWDKVCSGANELPNLH